MTLPELNFEGFHDSECGEHRTVGPHRAWCFACGTWCYPDAPCPGCEAPRLRAEVEQLRGVAAAAGALLAHLDDATPSAWRICNECDRRGDALRTALEAKP